MSQGLSVVYIVEPAYADAGRRPVFSSAEVSPYTYNPSVFDDMCTRLVSSMKGAFSWDSIHVATYV
jgi:hypothetical protein